MGESTRRVRVVYTSRHNSAPTKDVDKRIEFTANGR